MLLKILDVLKNALTSPLGDILTDEAVCEMMETGLSMCCQMRLSGASVFTASACCAGSSSAHRVAEEIGGADNADLGSGRLSQAAVDTG